MKKKRKNKVFYLFVLATAIFSLMLSSAVTSFAERDENTIVQPKIGSPGGSVWDRARENGGWNSGELGEDTGNTDDTGNTGDRGGRTGGRLVDPDRDTQWGDGTVTPDTH